MTSIPPVAVVAIVAAHNEEDILETVIGDLHAQGIQVYVMDDGSTDSTAAIAERLRGHGVIGVERLEPALEGADVFSWARILERKAALALELPADWFIHHDADEFRESPWPRMSLADAIARVDAMGYNAIDSIRLDFWPVDDRDVVGDVRDHLDHYAPPAPYDQRQVRIWKRTVARVDLATTGGHEVRFDGRRVCPARFILKHYPIRGQRHGQRKIFDERIGRFSPRERARGWHVQYDGVVPGQSLIRDRSSLVRYDPESLRLALALTEAPAAGLEQELLSVRSELTIATQRHDADRVALNEALSQVRVTRAELDRLERQRDELSSQLDAVRHRLTTAEEQMKADRARLDETMDLFETARADLEEERKRRGDLEQQATATRVAITALQRENHGLRYQLEDIRGSLSWRWTAPVRWALRGLVRPR